MEQLILRSCPSFRASGASYTVVICKFSLFYEQYRIQNRNYLHLSFSIPTARRLSRRLFGLLTQSIVYRAFSDRERDPKKVPYAITTQTSRDSNPSTTSAQKQIGLMQLRAPGIYKSKHVLCIILIPILRARYYTTTATTAVVFHVVYTCLLYTSPSPRDKRQSRMPSSA